MVEQEVTEPFPVGAGGRRDIDVVDAVDLYVDEPWDEGDVGRGVGTDVRSHGRDQAGGVVQHDLDRLVDRLLSRGPAVDQSPGEDRGHTCTIRA